MVTTDLHELIPVMATSPTLNAPEKTESLLNFRKDPTELQVPLKRQLGV